MTEIKVEKKRPVWPWIILILVVLGILAYVFLYSDNDEYSDDMDDMDDIEELDNNPTTSVGHITFSEANKILS